MSREVGVMRLANQTATEQFNYPKIKEAYGDIESYALHLISLCHRNTLREYCEAITRDVSIDSLKSTCEKIIGNIQRAKSFKALLDTVFISKFAQFSHLIELEKIEKSLSSQTMNSLMAELKPALYDAVHEWGKRKFENFQKTHRDVIQQRKSMHAQYQKEQKVQEDLQLKSALYQLFSSYYFISNTADHRKNIEELCSAQALIGYLQSMMPKDLNKGLLEKIIPMLERINIETFFEIQTLIRNVLEPVKIKQNKFDRFVLEIEGGQHLALSTLLETLEKKLKRYPEFNSPFYDQVPYRHLDNVKKDEVKKEYGHFLIPEDKCEPINKTKGIYLYRREDGNICALVVHNENFNQVLDVSDLVRNLEGGTALLSQLKWSDGEQEITLDERLANLIFDACIGIREVHIRVPGILYLDCELKLPGKNLVISAEEFCITKDISIDLSGRAGRPFTKKARNGQQMRELEKKTEVSDVGEAGENGRPGMSGESSGCCSLLYGKLVRENNSRLRIVVNGGKGANGQDGGDGEAGCTGKDGMDGKPFKLPPISYTRTVDAHYASVDPKLGGPAPGGKGGDGGHGGVGGEGGFPGRVEINGKLILTENKKRKEENSEHEDTIVLEGKEGENGKNGHPGNGGCGGQGGRYGKDYLRDFTICKINKDKEGRDKEGLYIRGTYKIIHGKKWIIPFSRLEMLKERDPEYSDRTESGAQGDVSQRLSNEEESRIKAHKNEFRLSASMSGESHCFIGFVDEGVANRLAEKVNESESEIRGLEAEYEAFSNLDTEIDEMVKKAREETELEYQAQNQHQQTVETLANFDRKKLVSNSETQVQNGSCETKENPSDYLDSLHLRNEMFNRYKSRLSRSELCLLETLLVKLKYEFNQILPSKIKQQQYFESIKKVIDKELELKNKVRLKYLLKTMVEDVQHFIFIEKNRLGNPFCIQNILGFNLKNKALGFHLLALNFRRQHISSNNLDDFSSKFTEVHSKVDKRVQMLLSQMIEQQYLQSIAYQVLEKIRDRCKAENVESIELENNVVIDKIHWLYGVLKKELIAVGFAENNLLHRESLKIFGKQLLEGFSAFEMDGEGPDFFLKIYQELAIYKQNKSFIESGKSLINQHDVHKQANMMLVSIVDGLRKKFRKRKTHQRNFDYLREKFENTSSNLIEKLRVVLLLLPRINIDSAVVDSIVEPIKELKKYLDGSDKEQSIVANLIHKLESALSLYRNGSEEKIEILENEDEKKKEEAVKNSGKVQVEILKMYQDLILSMGMDFERFVEKIKPLMENENIDNDLKNNIFENINGKIDFIKLKNDLCLILNIDDPVLSDVRLIIDSLLVLQEDINSLLNFIHDNDDYDNFFCFIKLIKDRWFRNQNFPSNVKSVSMLLRIIIDNKIKIYTAIEILNSTLPENWIAHLLHNALLNQVLVFFNNAHGAETPVNELPFSVSQLIDFLNYKPLLLSVLIDKLLLENSLISQKSKFSLDDFSDLLIKLAHSESNIEKHFDDLAKMPINQWASYLDRIIWVEKIVRLDDELFLKQEVLGIINRLSNAFDKLLVKRFIEIFSEKINCDSRKFIEISLYLIRNKALFTSQLLDLLSNEDPQQWMSVIKKKGDHRTSHVLGLEELIDTLVLDLNSRDHEVISKSDLLNQITKIKHYYKEVVIKTISEKPIAQWGEIEIKAWVNVVKSEKGKSIHSDWVLEHRDEVIAVIMRAVQLTQLTAKDVPRDTQILALLIYMDAAEKRQGRLGQVATGEGKTLITAMLAILHVLRGNPVNVITSSSVLAEGDAKDTKELYDLFGLSVSNNCDEEVRNNPDKRRERYRSQIIYGDVGSFQRDQLLTQFLGQGILKNRSNEILIVDEVDSMLLDKGDNTLYLSHDITDFRHLRHLYVEIWTAVNSPNIKPCEIKEYLLKKITDKSIRIPECLMHFVQYRLSIWIECANYAKKLEEDNQYVIESQNVVIMDNDTGVEQANMHWSNGLHQFLQLLETKKLTSESLKAVFKSNLSYFQNYAGRIYGMSGTLGTESDQMLFRQMYQLDYFRLPRFKSSQFQEDEGVVVSDKGAWLEAIEGDVQLHHEKSLSVLIICENIKKAKTIEKHLVEKKHSVCIYDKSSKELSVGKKGTPLKGGEIIIATNLAGRGKDLIISEELLKKRGELRVLLTYMPPNIRVEEQAFGRTARQGQRGSGKCIVIGDPKKSIDTLRHERDFQAMLHAESIRTSTIQFITLEKHLFKKFSKTHDEIKSILLERCANQYGKAYVEIQLKSLKDRWSFWLDEQEELIEEAIQSGPDKLYSAYDQFHKNMLEIAKKEDLFKFVEFPHELVQLGKMLLSVKQEEGAISCFNKVIEKYPFHCEVAQHWKAKIIATSDGKISDEKRSQIRKALKSERKLIEHRLFDDLVPTKTALDTAVLFNIRAGRGQNFNNFEEQVKDECALYQARLSAIDNIIGSPLTLSMFRNVLENDEARQTLYENLIKERDLVKSYRLSKKIKIEEREGRKILLTPNPASLEEVRFPMMLSVIQESVIEVLDNIIKDAHSHQANGNELQFPIDGQQFASVLISQEALWHLLIEHKLLEEKTSSFRLNVKADLHDYNFWFADDEDQKRKIKEILLEHNYQNFQESWFSGFLKKEQIKVLLDNLKRFNMVVPVKTGMLRLPCDPATGEPSLPVEIQEPYRSILIASIKSKLSMQQSGDKKEQVAEISSADFMLPSTNDETLSMLWKFLIDQGVIKNHEINISSHRTDTSEKVKRLNSWVKKQIEDLYDCQYIVTFEKPIDEDLAKVKQGKAIVFQKRGDSWIIHFVDGKQTYCQRSLNGVKNVSTKFLDSDVAPICYRMITSPPTNSDLECVKNEKVIFFEKKSEDCWVIHLCVEGKDYAKEEIKDKNQVVQLNAMLNVYGTEKKISNSDHLNQLQSMAILLGARIHASDLDKIHETGIFSKLKILEKIVTSVSNAKYPILNGLHSSNSKVNGINAVKNNSENKRIVVTDKQDIKVLKRIAALNGSGIELILEKHIDSVNAVLEQHIGKMKLVPEFVVGVKNLQKFFLHGVCPSELSSFSDMLFDEVLIFDKKISRWDWHAFAVALLGVAQVALGVALEVGTSGLLSSLGTVLIAEGISDMIYASRSGLMGQFAWKAYGMHKAMSVAMSTMAILTMGVGAVFSAGGMAGLAGGTSILESSGGTMLEIMMFAGKRLVFEAAKSVGGTVAGLALDQVFNRLPSVVQFRLGRKIQQDISESAEIKGKSDGLKETMSSLFRITDAAKAKEIINQSIKEVFDDAKNKSLFNRIINVACSLASEMPQALLATSSTKTMFLVNTLVSVLAGGIEFSARVYELIQIIPAVFDQLNEKLSNKIEAEKKLNKGDIGSDISQENTEFIGEALNEVQESITHIMLKKVTEEIIKPGLLSITQKAIQAAGNRLAKSDQARMQEERSKRVERVNNLRKEQMKAANESILRDVDANSRVKVGCGKGRKNPNLSILKQLAEERMSERLGNFSGFQREGFQLADAAGGLSITRSPVKGRGEPARRLLGEWREGLARRLPGERRGEPARRLVDSRKEQPSDGVDGVKVVDVNYGQFHSRTRSECNVNFQDFNSYIKQNYKMQRNQIHLILDRTLKIPNHLQSINDLSTCSFILTRNQIAKELKEGIDQYYREKKRIIDYEFESCRNGFCKLEKDIEENEKKIIRQMIALILMQKRIQTLFKEIGTLSYGVFKTCKSIDSEDDFVESSEILCTQCFAEKDPYKRIDVVKEYLGNIPSDDLLDLLNVLNQFFLDFGKQQKGENAMRPENEKSVDYFSITSDNVKEIITDGTNKLQQGIYDQKLSDLLGSGRMSEVGFVMNSFLTQMMRAHSQVIMSNTMLQGRIMDALDSLFRMQAEFQRRVTDISDKQIQFLNKVKESVDKNVSQLLALASNTPEAFRDPSLSSKDKAKIWSDYQKTVRESMPFIEKTINQSYENLRKMCGENIMGQAFLQNSTECMKELVSRMLTSVDKIADLNVGVFDRFAKVCVEGISVFINNKYQKAINDSGRKDNKTQNVNDNASNVQSQSTTSAPGAPGQPPQSSQPSTGVSQRPLETLQEREADEIYRKGKIAFKFKKTKFENVAVSFDSAKSKYKALLEQNIFSSDYERKIAENRLKKIKEGKYSESNIKAQFGES